MNVQNISPVFKTFSDFLGTANCFKNNPAGYLTIKRYAFNFIQHNLSTNNNCIFQNEFGIYSTQYNIYCNEVNSLGQNNAFYNKDNFELFVVSVFKSINFDIADESTLNLSLNLIAVLNSYGILSDIFSKQKLFIISKLNSLQNLNNVKVENNINVENNISNTNNKVNINNDNNINNSNNYNNNVKIQNNIDNNVIVNKSSSNVSSSMVSNNVNVIPVSFSNLRINKIYNLKIL